MSYNLDNESIVSIAICLAIIFYILSRFATYNQIIKNININLEKIAIRKIKKEFKTRGRKFYNDNGKLSAAADKAIKKYINNTNIACQFYSEDFYRYYKSKRPILKLAEIEFIEGYIRDHQTHMLPHNYHRLTPDRFFKLKKKINGDMVGVYIIYNVNKNKYYVGQATRLFFRVNQHFTGHGNGDVYGDFKRGKDKFIIKLVPLVNSGYYDLDLLEKDLIAKYKAYERGYNKTHGNG